MTLTWDEIAWDQYLWWQAHNKAITQRINALIEDIRRHGNDGIGKPEMLRRNLSGYWSRRINEEHRLVYRIQGDDIRIAACRFHYTE